MEKFFTYEILGNEEEAVRIGKGQCFEKTERGAVGYLRTRYGGDSFRKAYVTWHHSESAALKKERHAMSEYVSLYGVLPPWNQRHGGGGRQIYVKCKWCNNDALAGNYGFCGVHRR